LYQRYFSSKIAQALTVFLGTELQPIKIKKRKIEKYFFN